MRPFDTLFPDIAAAECRALQPFSNPDLPAGTFLFRELYCTDPRCDCRRALLQIWWAERKQVAATINYAFEPASPPFDDEPQIFLDPLNPQSDLSDGLRDLFEEMIANDPTYRDRLVRHYEMWKAVVDDPSHPDHRKVRSDHHDDPGFLPAFRASASASASASREPPPTAPKVGLNAPCPCGSGRKYKKCCRR